MYFECCFIKQYIKGGFNRVKKKEKEGRRKGGGGGGAEWDGERKKEGERFRKIVVLEINLQV